MRLVARPHHRPQRCAAIPFIAQTTPNVRWVDTGSTLGPHDERVYLSDVAVVEAMKVLGMPSRQDHAALTGELRQALVERDHYAAETERLTTELAELRAFRDAVDVIESADFRQRRKAGRPRSAA